MPAPLFTSTLLKRISPPTRRSYAVWLSLSLVFATYYSILGWQQAFASPYVVQEDMRQHIFWMARYGDPATFPNDLIADYFQSVAPLGYGWLYQGLAFLGLSPLLAAKLLPALLCLITAALGYAVSFVIFPIPLASFISSVTLSQSLWHSSELASGTPRAFLYPLFLAFLWCTLTNRKVWVLIIVGLAALFYPHVSLIALGILSLQLVWSRERFLAFARTRTHLGYILLGLALVYGIIVYTRSGTDLGDVVTYSEAIAMPEFQPNGRNVFFKPGLSYWLHGRSGLFHERGFTPATLIMGALLPALRYWAPSAGLKRFIRPQILILGQILVVSLGLFLLAHALLFELHLPNRYSAHSFRVVFAIATGISSLLLLDIVNHQAETWLQRWSHQRRLNRGQIQTLSSTLTASVLGGLLIVIGLYPIFFFQEFPKVSYDDHSHEAPLHEYFAAQPYDSTIASLTGIGSNIPMFARRTVLTSPEHAMAYHQGYYGEFSQRARATITAQYTSDPQVVLAFIDEYSVTHWLIDTVAFDPNFLRQHDWLQQYQPEINTAIAHLDSGHVSVVQQFSDRCTTWQRDRYTVLDANCLATAIQSE
jgi:hypothetical protein